MSKLLLKNTGRSIHQFGAKNGNKADPHTIKPGQSLLIDEEIAANALQLVEQFPQDFRIDDEKPQGELEAKIKDLQIKAKAQDLKNQAEAKKALEDQTKGKKDGAKAEK